MADTDEHAENNDGIMARNAEKMMWSMLKMLKKWRGQVWKQLCGQKSRKCNSTEYKM